MTTLNQIRDLIELHSDIVEEQQNEIIMYSFIDKATRETNGHIQLSFCNQATVAQYETDNHWFTPSKTCQRAAIVVRFLRSEKKGMGKLLLGYGVLAMSEKNKRIKYSILDDDSDASTKIKENIYSHFGYTPTLSTRQIGNDNVELSGGEKQVLITTFEEKAREYLLGQHTSHSRNHMRSLSRSNMRSLSRSNMRSHSRSNMRSLSRSNMRSRSRNINNNHSSSYTRSRSRNRNNNHNTRNRPRYQSHRAEK
jgi:hypothetical protein